MKVSDVMIKKVICATIPGTRREVLNKLIKHNITGMPVVNVDGNYQGVVTRKHIFQRPHEEQLAMLMDTSYPTVTPKTDINTATKLLVKNKIFRVPVVTNGKLVGVMGPSDLLTLLIQKRVETPVMEFLNEKCIPVWEMTPISVVAAMIKITGAYAFPVLDNNAKLSGIVTDRDIFNISQVGESIATTDLGLGEDEDSWTWEGLRNVMRLWYEVHSLDLPAIPVKEIMIEDPTTVFQMSGVSHAAREMRRNDYGQLPVRDDEDNLIGMVHDLDIIRALL